MERMPARVSPISESATLAVDAKAKALKAAGRPVTGFGNVARAAALAAVSGDLSAVGQMRTAFDRRRLTMTRMLNEIDGVVCPEPQGAFYCYPSVTGLLGKEIAGQRARFSAERAGLILDEAEVAVVPGEAFGTPGYFRLSCALGDADLEEGVSRMAKLLAEAK